MSVIKVIYIEQPRPGDTREYWARRWRMHGGFAMQFREFWDPIRIYIQNDCLADPSAFAGADSSFGGVGELFYADLESCRSSLATPNMDAILADGGQVFARRRSVHLIAETKDILGSRPGAVRVFAYASRPDGMARASFRNGLEQAFADSAAAMAAPPCHMAIAHNLEDRESHESVLDFSFHSLDEAVEGHAAWADHVAADAVLSAALLRVPLKVVTHSCILYDTGNFGGI